MREEKIRITIAPDGKTSIEVVGVKGKRCLDLTADLEGALGIVTERTPTKEMHERPVIITTTDVQSIHRR
jgi:hypothetical protein